MNGEVGENPTLSRNREQKMMPTIQEWRASKYVSRIATTAASLTTRRGLRGGVFFAFVNPYERFTRMFSKLRKIILLLSIFIVAPSLPVHADQGYRYWGYFQAAPGATSWTAAMTGPSTKLEDGAVEGWSFTASSNDIPATAPQMDPAFSEICGQTSQVAGKIRVGLVVDFGPGEIAPTGETPKEFFSDCIVVPAGSVGLDVLKSALPIRSDKSGLICGIAGYPATECGAPIELPIAKADASTAPLIAPNPMTKSSNNGRNIAIAVLAIFAIIVSGAAIRRKR